MLKRSTAVAGCLLFCACAPADHVTGLTPRSSIGMSESLPYGNRFRVPFTRDEMLRAHTLLGDREHAELIVHAIYDPDEETTGVGIMDFSLLLLAYLSDDVARRVVAYRPSLRQEVEQVRSDPEGWLESIRRLNREP